MWVIWFLLGLVAGSAANAVVDRLPRGESWVRGKSKCDRCGHTLGWKDLVPVASYVALGGKCRYCGKKIAMRNLAMELVMGLSFIVIGGHWLALGIFWVTTVIAVMDWETKLVHEGLVVVWGGLVILSHLGNLSNLGYLGGLGIGVGVIGGLWAVTRGRGMGFGDVEIAAVMGWWLGWPRILVGLWVAFVVGGLVGSYGLIVGRKKLKSEIAFGPFLILGAWVGILWGDMIVKRLYG